MTPKEKMAIPPQAMPQQDAAARAVMQETHARFTASLAHHNTAEG